MIELAPNNANGLQLRTPVMIASGCLGMRKELVVLDGIGAVVSPTVTLSGRRPERRLVETAGALLLGQWAEYSLASVLNERLESWSTADTPLLVSIRADYANDYIRLAQQLDERSDLVSGFEVCLTADGPPIEQVVEAIRAVSLLPILVKLPHRPEKSVELGQAAAMAGADALVVAAPPQVMHYDREAGSFWSGHMCGAAIFPLMLRMLTELVEAVPIAVIASGGITSQASAKAAFAAGARAIQIGSVLLSEPQVMRAKG